MQEGQGGPALSFKCTDTIEAYKFVQPDTSECAGGKIVVEEGSAGSKCMGITASATAAANRTVSVFTDYGRICYLNCDGDTGSAITPGTRLKSDADGQGVPVASDHDECGAVAMDSTSAASAIIKVMLTPMALYETG